MRLLSKEGKFMGAKRANVEIEPRVDSRSAGGKKSGGQRKAVPYWVPLAAERIFMEYSGPGKGNGLSVSDVVRYLKDIYDCEVSDDYVREKLIPAMIEFGSIEPRLIEEDSLVDYFGWKMGSNASPADGANATGSDEAEKKKTRRKGLYWFEPGRLFEDHEIELLIGMVDASPFMVDKDANDLVKKLRSLQFQGNRAMRAFLVDSDFDSVDGRAGEGDAERPVCDSGKGDGEVRPSTDGVLLTLSKLYGAIVEKRTISFTKLKYSAKVDMAGAELYRNDKRDGESKNELKDVTPYALRYADGHCFLLTSRCDGGEGGSGAVAKVERKNKKKDDFSIHRIDLMSDLKVSECDSAAYVELKDPREPFEYLRWSMNGMGGRRQRITMRCSEKALHFLIERFSGCEGWSVSMARAGSERDGRPEREKDWYTVTFEAPPKGIGFWVQKFLGDIDVVEPSSLRRAIKARVKENPYYPDRRQDGFDERVEHAKQASFEERVEHAMRRSESSANVGYAARGQ